MSRLPSIPKKHFDIKSKYLPKSKITLSPFTVGLESILLQVKDSEEESEKMDAIKQIIEECIQDKDLDVGSLPLFMVEEIFLRLRQNSIGELVDQSYQCTNDVVAEGITGPCNNVMPIQIDLREFKIIETEGHTNNIVISDPIGVKFKYPDMSMFDGTIINTQNEIETIISCIDIIYDKDNVYPASESSREELSEFWKQLTLLQKKLVFDNFFSTMPHLSYKKELVCNKCNHKHNIEFNSIKDVFQ
jgi:hypothetical protein